MCVVLVFRARKGQSDRSRQVEASHAAQHPCHQRWSPPRSLPPLTKCIMDESFRAIVPVHLLNCTVLPLPSESGDVKENILSIRSKTSHPLISTIHQTLTPQFQVVVRKCLEVDLIPANDVNLFEDEGGLHGFNDLRLEVKPHTVTTPSLPLDPSCVDVLAPQSFRLTHTSSIDIHQPSFPILAAYFTTVRVKAEIYRGSSRVAHPRWWRKSICISGLTAILLVMKLHGDITTLAYIFSLAPEVVASDLRAYSMGTAVGTTSTCILLSSIFSHLSSSAYLPNKPHLLNASTDLLVSHFSRRDYRLLLGLGKPNSVQTKLRRLMDIGLLNPPSGPLEYARFAAVRDGVIFGSMICFVSDLDRPTDLDVFLLSTTINAFISLSTPTHSTPSRHCNSILQGLSFPHRPTRSTLLDTIHAHFNLIIVGLSKRGWITGWFHELKGSDGLIIAEEYAEEARRVMEAVLSRMGAKGYGSHS